MKIALRAAAALCLAFGAVMSGGSAVFADPTPVPTTTTATFVDYAGTGTATTTSGGKTFTSTDTVHVRIDCADTGCTLTTFTVQSDPADGSVVFDLTDGMKIPVVNGKASRSMSAQGDPCGNDYLGPGPLAIAASSTGVTATRSTAQDLDVTCSGSSSTEYAGGAFTVTAPLDGGSPCILDHSCPSPKPTAVPAATVAQHHSRTSSTFSKPGTLSTLPTAAKSLTVHNVLWAAAITVVLVLLVAFPTHLFNSATETGADRFKEWLAKRRSRERTPDATTRTVDYRGWPLAAGGVLIASLISSFVDPTFGLNASSVRVYLSILTSFLLDAVAGWFLLIYFVRRANPKATATFRFAPASLLVVVAAVLFTRLTGFAPGIIFGLVAGVAFGTVLATAEKAKVALIGLGYSFVVAVIGWVGYSLLSGIAGTHPGAGLVFTRETLSSMAIGGIAALPIALIPLRGLVGYDLFTWNRWIWGAAYAVGLIGFFVVLMPLPFSWSGVHINLVVWIAVYLAYAAAAVAAWLIFTRPWRKPADA